jgi:hypothetical protein
VMSATLPANSQVFSIFMPNTSLLFIRRRTG